MADPMMIPRLNVGAPLGWVAPIAPLPNPFGGQLGGLDQVSLGNEVSDSAFFAQLNQMRASALASRMAAVTGQPMSMAMGSPYESGSSLTDFAAQMAALKQMALANAAQNGRKQGEPKKDGQTGQAEGGRFSVTAKAIERDGQMVPVKSISIHEVGNWGGRKPKSRDVEQYWDSWDRSSLEKTNTFDSPTKPGAYYQVTVTWADGSTKTVDRQMPESGDYNETIYSGW
ncbi:MAG: hypothetical protein AMXMBFR33_36620 [Candidatus Xenobia bacterium]